MKQVNLNKINKLMKLIQYDYEKIHILNALTIRV